MDRWGIPVTGLLLFLALCAYSAFTEPREIEADLTARSLSALQAAGIEVPPQGLRIEGQTAILTGPAGSPVVSEEARLRVENVWGITDVVVQATGGVAAAASTQAAPAPLQPLPAPPKTTNTSAGSAAAGISGTANETLALETKLQQTLAGKTIRFVPNRDILLPDAKQILNDVAVIMQAAGSKDVPVLIAGHTDSDGDAKKNVDLSKRRAAAVKRYLTSRGVAAARLSSEGYGAEKPVADNATADGKARNRRIEIHTAGAPATSASSSGSTR